jgi:hypothetical protein
MPFPVIVSVPNKSGISEPMAMMRTWLDQNRIIPSIFKYEFRGEFITFYVTFNDEDEAGKFSNKFGE